MDTVRGVLRVIFVVAIFLTLSLPVFAQSLSVKKKLQDMYVQYLVTEGYQPKIDEDGDVVFRREGRVYFIKVPDRDFNFFTVVLPNFWVIESENERAKIYEAANFSNGVIKVCKIYTVGDNTWATIELFVNSPEDFKKVFQRSMSALDSGVASFLVSMRSKIIARPIVTQH